MAIDGHISNVLLHRLAQDLAPGVIAADLTV